jgi:hypothetical protein
VPIILTPEVKRAIYVLNKARDKAGVHSDNPYIFAGNNNDSMEHIRGCQALKNVVRHVQLKNPEQLSSRKLRKYVATVSQIVDMNQSELGWLAKHPGHDIQIHKDFYRLQESTIEIAVVGNLLVDEDEGRAGQFKGRSLREINLHEFDSTDNGEEIRNLVSDQPGTSKTVLTTTQGKWTKPPPSFESFTSLAGILSDPTDLDVFNLLISLRIS